MAIKNKTFLKLSKYTRKKILIYFDFLYIKTPFKKHVTFKIFFKKAALSVIIKKYIKNLNVNTNKLYSENNETNFTGFINIKSEAFDENNRNIRTNNKKL